METITQLAPDAHDSRRAALWADLQGPMWTRLVGPATAAGIDVPVAGLMSVPAGPTVQWTPSGAPILVTPYERDRGISIDGGIAIPRVQLDRLQRLHAAGVRPDEIVILHPLPLSWQPGDPVPSLVPDPPAAREAAAESERRIRVAIQSLADIAGSLVRTSTVALTGALAVALSPIGLMSGVGADPVVLGGVRHHQERVAAWVVLAQWDWE